MNVMYNLVVAHIEGVVAKHPPPPHSQPKPQQHQPQHQQQVQEAPAHKQSAFAAAASAVASGFWEVSGGLPILCCFIASMKKQQAAENQEGYIQRRDTLYFIILVVSMGLAFAVGRYFLHALSMAMSAAAAPGVKNIKTSEFAHVARTALVGLQAAVNTVCSTALFLLFCQGCPHFKGQAGSSSFRMQETYAEHAYSLSLLALFRLMGGRAVRRRPWEAGGDASGSKKKASARSSSTLQRFDWALGAISLVVLVLMFSTLGLSSTMLSGPDLSSTVAPRQEWQQWLLFSMLLFIYLLPRTRWQQLHHIRGGGEGDGGGDDLLAGDLEAKAGGNGNNSSGNHHEGARFYTMLFMRVLVLAMGCTAFHLHLSAMDTLMTSEGGSSSSSSSTNASSTPAATGVTFDFYMLRRWGSISMLETDQLLQGSEGVVPPVSMTNDPTYKLSMMVWPSSLPSTFASSPSSSIASASWFLWWQRAVIEFLKTALQLWIALHAARWFMDLAGIIMQRLLFLDLDLQYRHAADVDDVYFSLATGIIFAGSYAAATPSATGTTASADGAIMEGHSFGLLDVVGSTALMLPVIWVVHEVVAAFRRLK